MGVHNITLGAGQTVDGKDVSMLNPVGWALLDEIDDDNTGSLLELDTGDITAKDLYMVIVYMQSIGADNRLHAQINNLSADNYRIVRTLAGTSTEFNDKSAWELASAIDATESLTGIWYLQGKKDVDNRPSIFGNVAPSLFGDSHVGVRGYYNVPIGDITRIRFVSYGDATGWIKIFGMAK